MARSNTDFHRYLDLSTTNMSSIPRRSFLLVALLSSLSSLIPGVASGPSFRLSQRGRNTSARAGRAAYFITNDETNAVVALPIGADGRLSAGTVTQTGGAGSVALNSDNQPATPDALVSQSALTIAGNVSQEEPI